MRYEPCRGNQPERHPHPSKIRPGTTGGESGVRICLYLQFIAAEGDHGSTGESNRGCI